MLQGCTYSKYYYHKVNIIVFNTGVTYVLIHWKIYFTVFFVTFDSSFEELYGLALTYDVSALPVEQRLFLRLVW